MKGQAEPRWLERPDALPEREVLLGNVAIAWGLIRAGCRFVTSYPGTPSSEILTGVAAFERRLGLASEGGAR